MTAFLIHIRSFGLQYAANQALQMGAIFYFMERFFYKGKRQRDQAANEVDDQVILKKIQEAKKSG